MALTQVALPESPAPARVEDYALSVLLHDIGKLWERSSDAHRPTPAELQLFCPRHPQTGAFTHLHAALSARFIDDVVRIPGAGRWGPRHHLPDPGSREELCAHLADRLAGEIESDESRDAPNAGETPLRSIFTVLSSGLSSGLAPGLAPTGPAGPARFLSLIRGDALDDSIFPRAAAPVSREDYRFHWNHLQNAIDKLGASLSTLETWCSLLEVFASRIPAASTNQRLKSIPDVDLYSHSRAVAALAVALHRGPLGQTDLLKLRSRIEEPPPARVPPARVAPVKDQPAREGPPLASLVRGVVLAARSFTSVVPRKRAVEALRGRSIFLDLLAEAAARLAIARLELPITSILHCDRRSFTLLAPPGVEAGALRDEVDRTLGGRNRRTLGFEAAAIDLRLEDLRSGLGAAWLALDREIASERSRRLDRLSRSEYGGVFGMDGAAEVPGELPGECASCEGPAPLDTGHDAGHDAGLEPGGERFCGLCEGLVELGAQAKGARFLVRRRAENPPGGSPGASPGGYRQVLAALDRPVEPVEDPRGLSGIEAVYSLGRLDLEALSAFRSVPGAAIGFREMGFGPSEEDLPGGPHFNLTAGAPGLVEEAIPRLPSGGAALPRILALAWASRRFFRGWAGAELARRSGGRLVLISASEDMLSARGELDAALDFAQALRRSLEMLAGQAAASFSAIVARETVAGEAAPAPGLSFPGTLTLLGYRVKLEHLPALREAVGWAIEVSSFRPDALSPRWPFTGLTLLEALAEKGGGKGGAPPFVAAGKLLGFLREGAGANQEMLPLIARWVELSIERRGRGR